MTRMTGATPSEPLEDAEHELEETDLGESSRPPRPTRASVVDRLAAESIGTAADLGHQSRQLATARSEQRRKRARIDVAEEGPEGFDERRVRQAARPERKAATD